MEAMSIWESAAIEEEERMLELDELDGHRNCPGCFECNIGGCEACYYDVCSQHRENEFGGTNNL